MHRSLGCLLSLFFLLCLDTPILALGEAEGKTCAAADEEASCRSPDDIPCKDDHEECPEWVKEGLCATNSSFMLSSCQKSCHMCDNVSKIDEFGGKVYANCWGKPQVAVGSTKAAVTEHINNVTTYMTEHVFKDPHYKNIRSSCRNLHEHCSFWAAARQRCENDRLFMSVVCSPSCYSCHLCAFDNETFTPDAWSKPGDVDQMFLRLVSEPTFQKFKPTVHFKPQGIDINTSDTLATFGMSPPNDGPWVVTLENFLDKEDCDTLIQLGHKKVFQPSMLASSQETVQQGRVSTHRTSTNAFCDNDCLAHPVVQKALKKMEVLTGIPADNAEHLQLVRYQVSQQYGIHHDYSPLPKNRVEGVRILTFFLYLNDVEAGGGTRFPYLNNFTIMPSTGKVLIWPNVLNEDPYEQDDRTFHEALPVESGIKYGANAWIHQRGYISAFDNGCLAVYQE